MTEPATIGEPVSEIPEVDRGIEHRTSKYDPVLDRAVEIMHDDDPIVPVPFKSSDSAHYGQRRIKDRIEPHEHDHFDVVKRGDTVYVRALEADEDG